MAIQSNTSSEVSFEGCVLQTYNRDYRAMSDVYTYASFALVWSFHQMKPVEVLVNANFECDQSGSYAVVDATETVVDLFNAYKAEQQAKEQARQQAIELQRVKEENERPTKGRIVKVFKGRKIAVGTTGYVFWTGFDSYGNAKLGIATSPEKVIQPGKRYASFTNVVFVAASNCIAIEDQSSVSAYQQ